MEVIWKFLAYRKSPPYTSVPSHSQSEYKVSCTKRLGKCRQIPFLWWDCSSTCTHPTGRRTSQVNYPATQPKSRSSHQLWVNRFGPKVGQVGPNGTNPVLFQIRFQYILAHCATMYWNLIWKSPGFVPFGANLKNVIGLKSNTPEREKSRLGVWYRS